MSIKYIKPVYSKTANKKDLKDKKTDGTGYEDASKYKDVFNDINEEDFARGIYENTEDRFTQELMNLPLAAGPIDKNVFRIPAKNTDNEAICAANLIEGYLKIYMGDETLPVAEQNKRTLRFMYNHEDFPEVIVNVGTVVTAKNKPANITAEDITLSTLEVGDIIIEVVGADSKTFNNGDLRAFARFNLEDDFNGDNLGEIELVMSDYKFEPRPTTIGVTWSQLAEITLDASFGLSAQDMLVTYAGDAIRINLDLRSFKLAYGVAKSNKDYITVFDAGYAKNNGSTVEGYFHTAQTLPSAIDTITDKMVNDINRGGVSRMVAGASAGTYMKLVKGTFSDKGRQTSKGIYQVGEFGGIPTFKAPSSIIPTNEILCVWKDDDNEGDVAIAFGTLVPFFNTGIIQRKNFYKEVGLATYGDWAVMNRRYLALVRIVNLKDTTAGKKGDETTGMIKYSNKDSKYFRDLEVKQAAAPEAEGQETV